MSLPPERARSVRLAAITVIAFTLVVPSAAFLASAAPASASGVAASTGMPGDPTVLWNGQDISAYSTPASAVTVTFNEALNLLYSWTNGGATANVGDARLQMFYFGFAVSTRDVYFTAGSFSSIPLNWTVGAIQYVVEGVFGLTASLINGAGTTVWSENFYVRLAAPYSILAIAPIVLILLAIYELYLLATCGREAGPRLQPAREVPPTAPTEAGGAAAPGAAPSMPEPTTPTAEPGTEPAELGEETPPGGSS